MGAQFCYRKIRRPASGYAEDAFDKSLPENQQFAFLPKPFTLAQLVAAVKETMTPS